MPTQKMISRRSVLGSIALAGAVGVLSPSLSFAGDKEAVTRVPALTYPYKLPKLPYNAGALDPVISKETMELHHGKHHQAYIDKLNAALKDHSRLQKLNLDSLLARLDSLPDDIRVAVRDNGGGHANHSMFWQVMKAPGEPPENSTLAKLVTQTFGGLEKFQTAFNSAGEKQFGSGWVFLSVGKDGGLAIEALPNQDTPLMSGKRVIFGNDVWEHAYYLTYRNRRADYLKQWWKVFDWAVADARYAAIRRGGAVI